jgi:hypothetical protein
MKPYMLFVAVFSLACTSLFVSPCQAQVVVNGKNLNNDRDLEYIQLMYYIDKSSIKPVFYVDYGFIEPEYTDIIDPERPDYQTVTINEEEVTDRVTVVWVLNKMNKAGWEYMGDVVFVPLRVMNDWHIYTLRRK